MKTAVDLGIIIIAVVRLQMTNLPSDFSVLHLLCMLNSAGSLPKASKLHPGTLSWLSPATDPAQKNSFIVIFRLYLTYSVLKAQTADKLQISMELKVCDLLYHSWSSPKYL